MCIFSICYHLKSINITSSLNGSRPITNTKIKHNFILNRKTEKMRNLNKEIKIYKYENIFI